MNEHINRQGVSVFDEVILRYIEGMWFTYTRRLTFPQEYPVKATEQFQ